MIKSIHIRNFKRIEELEIVGSPDTGRWSKILADDMLAKPPASTPKIRAILYFFLNQYGANLGQKSKTLQHST